MSNAATLKPIPDRLEVVKADDFKLLSGSHQPPTPTDEAPQACVMEAEAPDAS